MIYLPPTPQGKGKETWASAHRKTRFLSLAFLSSSGQKWWNESFVIHLSLSKSQKSEFYTLLSFLIHVLKKINVIFSFYKNTFYGNLRRDKKWNKVTFNLTTHRLPLISFWSITWFSNVSRDLLWTRKRLVPIALANTWTVFQAPHWDYTSVVPFNFLSDVGFCIRFWIG